jgi:hypothetical protein
MNGFQGVFVTEVDRIEPQRYRSARVGGVLEGRADGLKHALALPQLHIIAGRSFSIRHPLWGCAKEAV